MGVIIPSGGGGGGGGGTVNFSNYITVKVVFQKFQATGNDFILIDNRSGEYNILNEKNISMLCDRKFGIGADGLILLNLNPNYDFDMKYFNANGIEGTFCGNGARCAVKFAKSLGMDKPEFSLLASDGAHTAELYDDGVVSLEMKPISGVRQDGDAKVINTGSPHYVLEVADVDDVDVYSEGLRIRYSEKYKDLGINVNFVEVKAENHLFVRTYERGVEQETLSCGTGVVASALAYASDKEDGEYDIKVDTRGGKLMVTFDKNYGEFENIWLEGPASGVFKGELTM